MNRKEILVVYKQGPEAVVQLVTNMAARIQELEQGIRHVCATGRYQSRDDWAGNIPRLPLRRGFE